MLHSYNGIQYSDENKQMTAKDNDMENFIIKMLNKRSQTQEYIIFYPFT